MILIGSSSDWADPPSRQQASIVSTHAAHMQTAVHRVKSHWCVYFRASEGPGTAPAITGPAPQLHRELRGSTAAAWHTLSSSVIGVLRPQPRQSMLSAPMLHKRRRPTHPPSKAQVWRIGQPGLSVTVPIGSLAARILGTDMVRRPPGDGRAEGSVPLFPHTPTGRADGLRSS